jgi:hypothetical protein
MGIRTLTSFLRQFVTKERKNLVQDAKGKILVIDGNSLFFQLYWQSRKIGSPFSFIFNS